MTLWPRKWWPHTLSAQLVVVTTAAVLVSNLAVGLWFENTQELLTETALTRSRGGPRRFKRQRS